LDEKIWKDIKDKVNDKENFEFKYEIENTHRSVGTRLSHYLYKKFGDNHLKENSITLKLNGSAGQSLGAFLIKGLKILVEGDSNDYVGKGLSGGTIVIRQSDKSKLISNENIIIGNTVLYGATSGKAGERFAVRNSGSLAITEGCGDHGCEYMTGGTAIILGKIGRNFAAGMSGGIAYILNEDLNKNHFNYEMIELETPDNQDIDLIKSLVEKHFSNTSSQIAEKIIKNWKIYKDKFIKVMPTEYKLALEKLAKEKINQIIN